MVYIVQSYWACFGLYPSSCMWKTKDRNVLETGSVSVFRWMEQEKPTQLGPLERVSLKHLTNPESYVPTDGQPASLSWNKSPIWGQIFFTCVTITVLFL
jgi:hypothetical protein